MRTFYYIKGERSGIKDYFSDMKGKFSEKISAVEGEHYQMKDNFKTQVEEKIGQKIEDEVGQLKKSFKTEIKENFDKKLKNLEKQLVQVPVTEKTRDCFFPSSETKKLSTFDEKSPWDGYKT